MAFSLRGIQLPHKKDTAGKPVERLGTKNCVILPLVSNIGNPAVPVVKAGEFVKVGALVAEAGEGISSPVYASVSGKVAGIQTFVNSGGKRVDAVLIDSDEEMTVDENITAPVIDSKESLIDAMKKSGVVGLGGAGFPTYAKFVTDKKIDCLIVNGAECEPYITSDSYNMLNNADDIAYAIELITKFMGIENVIIAVEKNKPEAIAKMKELASANSKISVSVLSNKYPTGGEKVVVYCTTGRKIGDGKLPADVGCVVCNCTTTAALGKYFRTGMPVVEKCITVDGSAVKEPKNVIVPVGIALEEVFAFCGGFTSEPGKVLYGGPMMGISVPSLKEPVLKQTNAILAFTEKDAKACKETACIQCGTCTTNCPFGIDISEITRVYNKGEFEQLEKLGVTLCMECGCCAYNCPAKRPLVHNIKVIKSAFRAWKAKEAKE